MKGKWIIRLAVAAVAAVQVAPGAARPAPAPAKAPSWTPGLFWQFETRMRTTKGTARGEVTDYVVGRRRIAGVPVHVLVSLRRDAAGRLVAAHTVLVGARDFVIGELDEKRRLRARSRLLSFPLEPGTAFVHARSDRGRALLAEVEAAESVDTRAGTYRALPVRPQGVRGQETMWFAPALGYPVRLESPRHSFTASLKGRGRLARPGERVLTLLAALARSGDQGARLSAVEAIVQLSRAGVERARSRELLSLLAKDTDAAVRKAAEARLNPVGAGFHIARRAAQDPVTVGEAIGVLTTVWDFAEKLNDLTSAAHAVEVKRPQSVDLAVELGTTVTVPWEIDYTVDGSKSTWWLDFWDGAHYTCRSKVFLDDKLVQEDIEACDKGIDARTERLLAVVAKQWTCGGKNEQTLRVEASLERWYKTYEWVWGFPMEYRFKGFHTDTVKTADSAVKFKVYNPFFFTGFKFDQEGAHHHHSSQDTSVTVKARKRADFPNPSALDWTFDKLGEHAPWTYKPWVLGDWLAQAAHRHHGTKKLEEKITGNAHAEVEWKNVEMNHVERDAVHHDGVRMEEWRTSGDVEGTRNLGVITGGTAVPVKWRGELKESGEAAKCGRETQVQDADPGPH